MPSRPLTFHLVPDPTLTPALSTANGSGTEGASRPPGFEVPPGPSALVTDELGRPHLLAWDSGAANGDGPPAGTYVLEPILDRRRPQLSLLAPATTDGVRVNGMPAPRVVLLKPGDELQVERDVVLHIALFCRPFVGRAGKDHRGNTCPVCRAAVRDEDVVFDCVNCGSTYHVESEPGPGKEPLECVRICTSCSVCAFPIELTEGFTEELDL